MRAAIFDLDGTLADTSGDLIAAANHCFASDGLEPPLNMRDHAAVAFAGGRAMLLKGSDMLGLGWGEADIDRHYPRLLEYYGANIDRHTVLYDGVMEALDGLAAEGWRLGVCTNKPEGLARELLTRFKMLERFASLIGADTLPVRKPDAAPLHAAIDRAGGARERAVLVGDTITDADTGRAAGVPTVLVTFGPDGEGVRAHRPDAVIGHFRELSGVIGGLVN